MCLRSQIVALGYATRGILYFVFAYKFYCMAFNSAGDSFMHKYFCMQKKTKFSSQFMQNAWIYLLYGAFEMQYQNAVE